MKKNKLNTKTVSLTVAIPAYNEEKNIGRLINQLLSQANDGFVMRGIVVYSDASTDKTHDVVGVFARKYPIVKLITGNKRIGKYLRLNEIFTDCHSDVLVVLDADIKLKGKKFLSNLVKCLVKDDRRLMVAAHQLYIKPKGFVPRAFYAHFMLWNYVRFSLDDLNVAQNFYGSATAFKKHFIKEIRIPTNISDPHLYIFLKANEAKGFCYCLDAIMYQWPIMNLADFNKLLRRSLGKRDVELEKIFKIDLQKTNTLPLKNKIIGVVKSYINDPFYSTFAIAIVLYSKIRLIKIETDRNAVWEIVNSTKRSIN